ncbi:hypothetical protein CSOJ01_06742 [Colletotrichum sojae]|uniref:Uncharacterized protein n=1 Tax=Colletotrichum sojae TaxID=2175907 RepID=A0A8H6MUQ5_9PEZI|nr:hypothetical protein CSOJ01_06742 [Colletotrichum sojae]
MGTENKGMHMIFPDVVGSAQPPMRPGTSRRSRHRSDEDEPAPPTSRPEVVNDADTFSQETVLASLTRLTGPRSRYCISSNFTTRSDEVRMRLSIPIDLLQEDYAWTRAWLASGR